MPAGSSTIAKTAGRGCDPRRATAAYFAPMGRYRARQFRLPVIAKIQLAAGQVDSSRSRGSSVVRLASFVMTRPLAGSGWISKRCGGMVLLAILLVGVAAGWAHGQASPTFVPRDESPEDFAPGPGRE